MPGSVVGSGLSIRLDTHLTEHHTAARTPFQYGVHLHERRSSCATNDGNKRTCDELQTFIGSVVEPKPTEGHNHDRTLRGKRNRPARRSRTALHGALASWMRACASHPWRVVLSWLGILALLIVLVGTVGGSLKDEFEIPDRTPSGRPI